MNPLLERALVGLIVSIAIAVSVRALMPFGWRVRLARAIASWAPDRIVVWLAGRQGCESCGDGAATPRRR